MTSVAHSTRKRTEAQAEGVQATLTNLFRLVSQHQLELYTKQGTVTIRDIPSDYDMSFDHWIASIAVSGEMLRFRFRVHFTSVAARHLAAMGLGMDPEKVPARIAHDFMREYCNLTAGSMKRWLQNPGAENVSYQVSLPHKKAAYSDVKLAEELPQSWSLAIGGCEVICVSNVTVFHPESLQFLADPQLEATIRRHGDPSNLIDEIIFL